MFGFYEKGLKQKEFSSVMDMPSLVQRIKGNPCRDAILRLHTLDYGSDVYKSLKETLPTVTVHGLFRESKSKQGFIQPSGFLYYDIDAKEIKGDLIGYKRSLIRQFNSYIHMMGVSCGGRGLFFFIKVDGITTDNFDAVYEYYRVGVFKGLNPDINAKGIHRSQFVPYDKDVYHSPDCILEIPSELKNVTKEKETFNVKKNRNSCYTLNVPFISIDRLLQELRFETEVTIGNELFVIEPIEYCRAYLRPKIQDGKKHTTFRAMTNILMYLNPGISLLHIQSYINYVNQNHTTEPMITKEMLRTVEHEYNRIIETGEILVETRVKTLHLNKNHRLGLSGKKLANKVNGLIRRYSSVKLIEGAVAELERTGRKVTGKAISELTGLSSKTVSRNRDTSGNDIACQILALNSKLAVDESTREKGTNNV